MRFEPPEGVEVLVRPEQDERDHNESDGQEQPVGLWNRKKVRRDDADGGHECESNEWLPGEIHHDEGARRPVI